MKGCDIMRASIVTHSDGNYQSSSTSSIVSSDSVIIGDRRNMNFTASQCRPRPPVNLKMDSATNLLSSIVDDFNATRTLAVRSSSTECSSSSPPPLFLHNQKRKGNNFVSYFEDAENATTSSVDVHDESDGEGKRKRRRVNLDPVQHSCCGRRNLTSKLVPLPLQNPSEAKKTAKPLCMVKKREHKGTLAAPPLRPTPLFVLPLLTGNNSTVMAIVGRHVTS